MSFFRTPIDPEVQQELFRRIDGLNKATPYDLDGKLVSDMLGEKSEALENEYFKSCWARVVTIDGNGKEYYLNSQLGEEGKKPITEPLNIKDGKYSRGRAGITSISSNFKEFFLKQSTISFMCPDPKEFERIQKRFLKHGRYVLVEFGWSTRKNIVLKKINTDNLVRFSENLNQRTKGSRGNYAAICGVITNFNFNQKQDGSYEGTFEVSSMGRNILGQKIKTDGKIENLVNFVNERVKEIEEIDDPETDVVEGTTEEELARLKKLRDVFISFHATIKALPDVVKNYVDNSNYTNSKFNGQTIITDDPNFKSQANVSTAKISGAIKELEVIRSKNGAAYLPGFGDHGFKKPVEGSKLPLAYCTWGWFEDYILNSFFAFTSKSGNREFKTRFFSTDDIFDEQKNVVRNESTKCKTNPELYSLGLQSVILPGKFKQFSPDNKSESDTDIREVSTLDAVTDLYKFVGEKSGQYVADREKALSKIIGHFNDNEHFKPFDKVDISQQRQFEYSMNDLPPDPNNLVGFPIDGDENNIMIPAPFEVNVTGDRKIGQIRNMVFEVNYLMKSFENATNIDEALMRFWQKVSSDYGNFWRFGIVEDDNTDGKIKVVDLNIGQIDDRNASEKKSKRDDYKNWNINKPDPGGIFRFPLYEKNSFIQDFSIETAYDSEMATMAVFGSNADMQATRGDMGQGYTELAIRALSLLNNPDALDSNTTLKEAEKQKYDAILSNLQVPVNTNQVQQGASSIIGSLGNIVQKLTGGINFKEVPEIQEQQSIIEEEIEESNEYNTDKKSLRKGYFWFNRSDETVQIYANYSGQMMKEFKRTMLYYINKSADPTQTSNYNVVLPAVPLQLSLTIQGIGGIKIGDLFYIDYLPQIYKKYCHFMVVGVDHEISTTGWTTKLDSRMIVDIPKLIEDSKGKLTKTEFKPFLVLPGEQLTDTLGYLQERYGKGSSESDQVHRAYGPEYQAENLKDGSGEPLQAGGGNSFKYKPVEVDERGYVKRRT